MRQAFCGSRACRSKPRRADTEKLVLLRVEIESVADVGLLVRHLGRETFRYDPLTARMVSHRKRLRFIYFDGQKPRALRLAESLALASPNNAASAGPA